jgi:hypothetical protein
MENGGPVDEPVRILLLEVPQMLRDILAHAIQRQHGCELLTDAPHGFHRQEPAVSPDVVILGLQAEDDATLVPAVFARWPTTQVMTVMQAGGGAAMYELRRHRRSLEHLSLAELVGALRDTVRQRRDSTEE